jgi:phosphoribosylaminoimidazole-succinocarboxamide synthase
MDELLASGKTKKLFATQDPNVLRMQSLDNLSAGDGARQSKLSVAAFKNRQNALIMKYLQKNGINTSFLEQVNDTESLVKNLKMLGVEFVVRGVPFGSYLLRNPEYTDGMDDKGKPVLSKMFKDEQGRPTRFDEPLFEMFHKNTFVQKHPAHIEQMSEDRARDLYLKDGVWQKGVHTDPYIKPEPTNAWGIYSQKKPIEPQNEITRIPAELSNYQTSQIKNMSMDAFKLLEQGLAHLVINGKPITLADIKFEFGLDDRGNVALGDVVDNDSWRIWVGGDPVHGTLDKQLFRDNAVSENKVVEKYAQVTNLLEDIGK